MMVDSESQNMVAGQQNCFSQRRQTNLIDTQSVQQCLVTLNDDGMLQDREKLQKYIKQYIKKRQEFPPTTVDYYRFMKLIGKGAFGKVTLGIHKLSGKQVAIKTVDKSLMKDEYSKKKLL